jgi:hypothetical protein
MSRLLGSQIGSCHEGVITPDGFLDSLGGADVAWASAADRAFYVHMLQTKGHHEPIMQHMVRVMLIQRTCRRQEVVRDHV